ncbi:MAG: YadA-like family protein [Cetobacterium sp.]|nr:YadA-like family protein [Cetobacterium sp.]
MDFIQNTRTNSVISISEWSFSIATTNNLYDTLKIYKDTILNNKNNKVSKTDYAKDQNSINSKINSNKIITDKAINDLNNSKVDKSVYQNDKKIISNTIANSTNAIRNNKNEINRLNNKINTLDSKVNKGMSLISAMNSIDFNNAKEGDILLGAGIGHYLNSEAVTIGVAYIPNKDLSVNAEYSVSTDNIETSTVGIGMTYRLFNTK